MPTTFRDSLRSWLTVATLAAAGLGTLFDGLLAGLAPDEEGMLAALDGIVRVRAVQEMPARQALAFPFALKGLVRELLGPQLLERQTLQEYSQLASRIDDLALTAFELYRGCRERVYEIRCRELRRQTDHLLRLAAHSGRLPDGDLPDEMNQKGGD